MVLFWVLVLMLIPAGMAAALAVEKDRSGGLWFFLGLLFSWITVLVVACLPKEGVPESTNKYTSGHSKPLYYHNEVERSRREAWRDFKGLGVESINGPSPTKPVLLPIPSKPLSRIVPYEPRLSDDKYQQLLGSWGAVVPLLATKQKRQEAEEKFTKDHVNWEQLAAKIRAEGHEEKLIAWKEEIQRIDEKNRTAEAEYVEQVREWKRKGIALIGHQQTDLRQTQGQISESATGIIQISLTVEPNTTPVELLQKFLTLQEKYQPYRGLSVSFKKPTLENPSIRFVSIKDMPDFQEIALEFITQEELERWERTKLGDLIILHGPIS